MKCDYGCNKEAKFQMKNGKWCCSEKPQQCDFLRKKNSVGVSKAHKDGRCSCKGFDGKRGWRKGLTAKTDDRIHSKDNIKVLKEVMVKNSSYNRGHLKKRMLDANYIKEKCTICGFEGDWNGKSIVFYLDHINGINNDHRRKNLRMLCPMCNTQQNTFAGRNKTRS